MGRLDDRYLELPRRPAFGPDVERKKIGCFSQALGKSGAERPIWPHQECSTEWRLRALDDMAILCLNKLLFIISDSVVFGVGFQGLPALRNRQTTLKSEHRTGLMPPRQVPDRRLRFSPTCRPNSSIICGTSDARPA